MEIDHIQIAAPESCETAAREFYGQILGLIEIAKPAALQARGGCWFQCGEHQLHIGVGDRLPAGEESAPRLRH